MTHAIHRRALLAQGILALFCHAFAAVGQDSAALAAPPWDLLIVNGHVVDGSGNPWFAGDIGIREGRILAVGRLASQPARRRLDAHGLVVAPGFIDLHTHSDIPLLVNGTADSMVRQGVTLNMLSEGDSIAPIQGEALNTTSGDAAATAKYLGIHVDWSTLTGYFDRLGRQGVSLNVGSYVGAGQVRACVLGNTQRDPTPAELGRMRSLVRQTMEEGAFGLSSCLTDPPQMAAKTDELVELAKVAAEYGGIYATHLRDYYDRLLEAVEEAVFIGERARLPVHIFHLTAYADSSSRRMSAAIEMIEAARARGIDATANNYPYEWAMHPMLSFIPPWAHEGGMEALIQRLKDPQVRARLRREIGEGIPGWYNRIKLVGFDNIVFLSGSGAPKGFVNKSIAQIARETAKDPHDALFDLVMDVPNAMVIYKVRPESAIRTLMKAPWQSFSTDGFGVPPAYPERQHPRSFGTFPRVLATYVREQRILTLEEAVRRMTSLPAQVIGLRDRGLLREGFWADAVIFDPARVTDRATYDDPEQYPDGIEYVLVNGVVVVDHATHTGAKPGKILRGSGFGQKR